MERVGVAFKFSGYACQAADLSLAIDKRHFIGDVPLDEALRGGDELYLVLNDVSILDDSFVVLGIALLDVIRKEIGIGPTHDFALVLQPHKIGQFLVYIDKVPIGIFDEE